MKPERNLLKRPASGALALAHAAIESGVSLVTGYPGSPATAVVNAILDLTSPDDVKVEWISNEKVAMEIAFGASLGGQRALLCVKGVGLNIGLDPLMTMNLSGCRAGFVILVGDDPGGWGSQNEQDSRALAALMELPWLEPTTVSDAHTAMRDAFALSEEMELPVVLRITRALAVAEEEIKTWQVPRTKHLQSGAPPAFQREFMRWVVLPINVVPYHRRLLERLSVVQDRFERSALNGVTGDGLQGVVTSGFTYQKLLDLLGGTIPAGMRVLRLGTFYPLPARWLTEFLITVESALVVEETAPLIERGLRDIAQNAGLTLPIYGRDTAHLPTVGELFAADLTKALKRFLPGLALPTAEEQSRPRPSRQPLCDGCPYLPTFDGLQAVIAQRGGRDPFIVVGDPGCMVRAQMPPYELMDVKHSLGSAIGMATGIAAAQGRAGKRVIALCGDSGFLHSGLNGLVDAARLGVRLLVLVLDNGTTALSGGQPHPASPVDTRGRSRRTVDLAALAHAAGAGVVRVADLDNGEDIQPALAQGLDFDGLAVVIARGQCIL